MVSSEEESMEGRCSYKGGPKVIYQVHKAYARLLLCLRLGASLLRVHAGNWYTADP